MMKQAEKISIINQVLEKYFETHKQTIAAKDMMPQFIQAGVFDKDRKEGLPIRDLLRDLDAKNCLHQIPFITVIRRSKNRYWYFSPIGTSLTHKQEIVKSQLQNKKKDIEKKSRENSDEYYVITLCNEVLGHKASQQHSFDFLRGDSRRKLLVDAYYEDLNLVVEYYEKQHTESVIFFDKPDEITVSGVNRNKQRKIYDERRKTELAKHGINLVIISYSDFGTSKKLKRNKESDIEVVKKILEKYL